MNTLRKLDNSSLEPKYTLSLKEIYWSEILKSEQHKNLGQMQHHPRTFFKSATEN